LVHEGSAVEEFYAALPRPVTVGIESTGYAIWFHALMRRLGHTVLVGDAAKIRAMVVRKTKTDQRGARHDPEMDGIPSHAYPHDRNRLGCLLGGQRRLPRPDDHDVKLEADELSGVLGVGFFLAKSVSVFDSDVLSLNVAEAAQPLTECRDVGLCWGRGFHRNENPDPLDVPGLLCLAIEWRSQCPKSEPQRNIRRLIIR